MSWADDIRCLYCDGRLPLYRKITNGQFCSGAHRKAYWQEHERLAVERLHQTHDSLRAYRVDDTIAEKILGPAALKEELTQVPSLLGPEAYPNSTADALGIPMNDEIHSRPQWTPERHVYTEIAEPKMAKLLPPPIFRLPRFLPDYVAVVDVYPIESSATLLQPVAIRMLRDYTLVSAPAVPIPVADVPHAFNTHAVHVESIYPGVDVAHPELRFALELAGDLAAQNQELQALLQEEQLLQEQLQQEQERLQQEKDAGIPEMLGLLALPLVVTRESVATAIYEILPASIVLRAQLPLNILRMGASLVRATLLHAGLRQLPVSNLAQVHAEISQDNLRALDLRTGQQALQLAMSSSAQLEPRRPRLSLAAGRRYRVETQPAAPFLPIPDDETFASMPPEISLPERKVKVLKGSAGTSSASAVSEQTIPQNTLDLHFEPSAMGMLPLPCTAQPSLPGIAMRPAPAALSLPQPLEPKPMRPDSKLEPIDTKPTSDAIAASQPMKPPPQAVADGHAHVWTHAIDFWNRAPRDLKMLVFAIPVLLGLALHPALPKVRLAAPAAANGIERSMQHAFSTQWVNVRQTMLDRAAVALDEDFRQGLDEWTTRGDATAEWSFDGNGFVRPGSLALYRPSMTLSDYQMQFMGVLDKQALSWVVRAQDFDNFYVIKLMTLKTGPLPTIGVVRYAVVNGKADARADTIAPLDVRTDSIYRVRVDVRGDDFALSVQGQMVDSWSEPRLRRGGIGFFSARGEESRLRWVQVTHQYDMLGRLCAYLAPYNIPTTTGSWQQ